MAVTEFIRTKKDKKKIQLFLVRIALFAVLPLFVLLAGGIAVWYYWPYQNQKSSDQLGTSVSENASQENSTVNDAGNSLEGTNVTSETKQVVPSTQTIRQRQIESDSNLKRLRELKQQLQRN